MDEDEEDVPAAGPTAPDTPAVDTPDAPPALSPITLAGTEPPAQPTEPLQSAQIPSNAIELTNTAPIHTEAGQGDLGVSDVGMEVHVPERQEDHRVDGEEAVPAPVLEGRDEGLVMGEMQAPEAEMAVEGGDAGPAEVE